MYLRKWLNGTEGRQQSGPVKNIEADFADGLRFVELLVYEKVMPADALDRLRGRHPLEVFDEVCSALDGIECAYSTEAVGRAAQGQRGGASALLLSVKTTLEARGENAPPPVPKQLSTFSVRPKAFERPELDDWGKDDFFQKTYETYDIDEFNKIDMAVHLRRFHDEQRELERRQTTLEDAATAAATQKQHDTYDHKIERAHERASFLRAKLDVAEQHWRDSRVAMIEAERSELRYEVTMQKRHHVLADIHRFMLTREVDSGIGSFEKNMKRLGTGGDVEAPGGKVMSTAAESALAYLERIEEIERNTAMTPQEALEMLVELRVKAKANAAARLERERRRRKMVVDQASAARELEAQKAKGQLLGGLLDDGKRQRAMASKRWEAGHRTVSEKRKRSAATATLQGTANAAMDVAIDRLVDGARATHAEEAPARAAKSEILAMEKARAQHRRARTHTAACADIIDGLIFLVMSVVEAKEEKAVANGGVPVPLNLSEWLALRRGFVRDTLRPRPPPPLPVLSIEDSAALAVEFAAMQSLEGGWKAPALSVANDGNSATEAAREARAAGGAEDLSPLPTTGLEMLHGASWPASQRAEIMYHACVAFGMLALGDRSVHPHLAATH